MRFSIPLLLVAVIVSPLRAQDATQEPLPSAEPPMSTENPFELIPEPVPGGETPNSELPADDRTLGKTKTIQSEADLKQRIRYREIKTRALRDARLQQFAADAESARTMPEKREALRAYYARLCERIISADSSLKPLAQQRKRIAMNRLRQTRFASTTPAARDEPAPETVEPEPDEN